MSNITEHYTLPYKSADVCVSGFVHQAVVVVVVVVVYINEA